MKSPSRGERGRKKVVPATVSIVSDVQPPDDPDEWTDDQWIEWLKATDDVEGVDEEPPRTGVRRISSSAGGQMLGQAMLGMAQAIYGRQDDDIVLVVESGGETADDVPFAVHLDHEHPERSSIVFRPDSAQNTDEA